MKNFFSRSKRLFYRKPQAIKRTIEEIARDGVVNKKILVHRLVRESVVDSDFYFLLIASVLIITLGLLMNNTAVVIGGMMIAPILSPILALGLVIVTGDWRSFFHRFINIIKIVLFVLAISYLTTLFVGVDLPLSDLIRARFEVNVVYFYIALLSGFAATYTWIKPKFSVALPGVAVSVAILPPLSVAGIGFSFLNKTMIVNSLILFLLNLTGIILSSAIVFAFFGFANLRKIEEEDTRKEEKLEREKSVI